MDLQIFAKTVQEPLPPQNLSVPLTALWYDKKGDWDTAHNLIDQLTDATSSWVHAYLHRKEGDNWNADYWYRRAGKTRPDFTLEEEWSAIAKALLQQNY